MHVISAGKVRSADPLAENNWRSKLIGTEASAIELEAKNVQNGELN